MVVRSMRGGWIGLGALVVGLGGCQADCPPADTAAGGDDTSVEETDSPTVLTPADCPAYSGFGQEGASWTYTGTTSTLTFTQTVTRVQNGYVDLSTSSVQQSGENTVADAEGRLRFRCATDGLWRLDGSTTTTTTTGEDVSVTHDVRVYGPDTFAQALPATMETGTTWETHHVGTTSDATGPRTFDYVVSNEVVGVEEVTVAAGTFTTLHVVVTTNGTSRNEWRDPVVGVVLGDYLELVSYTR